MNTAARLLRIRSLSSCRRILPPELSKDTVKLTCDSTAKGGVCDVLLLGTYHDTQKSCQQVRDVVNFLKPEVVFLELCENRAWMLMPDWQYKVKLSLINCCRVLYANVTNQPIFESEFRVAYMEAQKYGAKVILGDRRQDITNERFIRKMVERPLWHIMKYLISPFQIPFLLCEKWVWQAIKNKDYKRVIFGKEWVRLRLPDLADIILDERDQYMSTTLLEVARKHNSVVAIVGKAHLSGIPKYWKQPIQGKEEIFEWKEANAVLEEQKNESAVMKKKMRDLEQRLERLQKSSRIKDSHIEVKYLQYQLQHLRELFDKSTISNSKPEAKSKHNVKRKKMEGSSKVMKPGKM